MKYNRLFYRNITFKCNNKCRFCISHNTKRQNTSIVEDSLKSIKICDSEYNISNSDLFIISGGEPTVSPEFNGIINFLLKKQCKIVVYTNGRKLDSINHTFLENSNIRWIIPFYGLSGNHDYYTNTKNSFYETFECVHKLKKEYLPRISIKFLIKKRNQIQDFYKLYSMLRSFSEFHFSAILDNNINEQLLIATEISDLIKTLFRDGKKIKISNIPLCHLENGVLGDISSEYNIQEELEIGEYYFIKKKITAKMEYDKLHCWLEKCPECSLHRYCTDNSLCYRPLVIDNKSIYLGEE